jgi:riboflavin kinase/FMN adenylyltransferase
LTFDPHPQIVLQKPGRENIKLLTSIEERIYLFEKFGVENLFIIPFDLEFSQTPPDVFVKEMLFKKIGLKKLLIGFDHNFGKNREGNQDLLDKLSAELGFETIHLHQLLKNNKAVSSTIIRTALSGKDIGITNSLLGHEYFILGQVYKNDGRGSKIGFPTANVTTDSQNKLLPPGGIYFVKVEIDNIIHYGMANLGTRPTFTDSDKQLLEVNIFDFNQDIYGKTIKVFFIKYLRDEKKFDSIDELVIQINRDKNICIELIKMFSN